MPKYYTIYDKNYNQELSVVVGTNAKDNHAIIDEVKEQVKKDNLLAIWFHLETASAHAILILPNKNCIVSRDTKEFCVNLIKPKNKKNIKCRAIYTWLDNVNKNKTIGEVSFVNENEIYRIFS